MLLDKSLMEKGHFSPQLAMNGILGIVREAADILQGQAALNKVDIVFRPQCEERELILDEMRI